MSTTYRTHFSTRSTPQSESIPNRPEMVKNSADGYGFAVDDWKRLERFLILGSEGGTYYANERKLTIANAEAVQRCIAADGVAVVKMIVEISEGGRAAKNDPALFALAMCAGMGDLKTRQAALSALPRVARIGTHLFHFLEFVEGFRGWGRGLKRTVANWYNGRPLDRLAYQVVKYQQRDGWSHRDALRLAHPNPGHDEERKLLYSWIVNNDVTISRDTKKLGFVYAFDDLKEVSDRKTIIDYIDRYRLTREMIPTEFLNDRLVWGALLQDMPLGALVRNLGKMTQVKLIKPMGQATQLVASKLTDQDYIKRSRLHPIVILVALSTYVQGHGVRGKLSWSPVREIIEALNEAFYLSFANVEPTGKRLLIGVDVSGSMMWQDIAGTHIKSGEAAAALSLVVAKTEKYHHIVGYDTRAYPKALGPSARLDHVIESFGYGSGGTDCAVPILYALQEEISVDTFVTITDNETWAGEIHPVQALRLYRERMNIPAKLVTVGMTSSGFTIADPSDGGMLDVVGFDTGTPRVISDFAREGPRT